MMTDNGSNFPLASPPLQGDPGATLQTLEASHFLGTPSFPQHQHVPPPPAFDPGISQRNLGSRLRCKPVLPTPERPLLDDFPSPGALSDRTVHRNHVYFEIRDVSGSRGDLEMVTSDQQRGNTVDRGTRRNDLPEVKEGLRRKRPPSSLAVGPLARPVADSRTANNGTEFAHYRY